MRKTLTIILLALCAILQAQTQSGYVRTVSRPGVQSQRIQGVVVRVRGDYNPVLTDEQGSFGMLLPGLKNGQAYILGGVSKAGDFLLEPLVREYPNYVLFNDQPLPPVKIAVLGSEAGIIGAAMLS